MNLKYTLESLYFYWVNCDDIWAYAKHKIDFSDILPKEINEFAKINQPFLRLTIAYGLLYVVVEAYQQLELVDNDINLLLENSDYVEKLKRLRNSIFHFQKEPMGEKVMNFINIDDSHIWINDLKKAFEKFFIKNIPLIQSMIDKTKINRKSCE